jgi:hypothetical protein
MVIASYVAPKDERKYARKRLGDARLVVRNFRTLDSLVADFKNLSRTLVRNNHNALFGIASWSNAKDHRLSDLEEALRISRFRTWPKKLQNDFSKRLLSPKPDSWSALCEMNVALRLSQQYGKKNLALFPAFPKKGPDAVCKIDKRNVYFEVTSIVSGRPKND